MSAAAAERRPANGNSATPPPPDESAGGEQQPTSSRFTAVNGRSPSASEDRSRQVSGSSSHPSDDSALNPRSRDSTHQQQQHHPHHHHHHHHPPQQRDSQPPPAPAPHQRRGSHSSSGKRKHGSSGGESPASAASQQSQKKRRGTTPSERPRPAGNGAQDYTGPDPAAYAAHRGNNEHTDDRIWQGHHRDGSSMSDTHLAEALQRESQQLAPHQMGSVNASPEQRYPVVSTPSQSQQQLNPLVPAQTPTSTPMSASNPQKARKRNFSNRTKTGCMTCRERKKKCDEGKPVCHNCERGGFVCKGYSQSNHYKHGVIRDAPPIQAKNGYYEQVGPYPYQSVPPRHEYYDAHAAHPPPHPPPPAPAPSAAAAAAAAAAPPPRPVGDAPAAPHRPISGEEERPHVSTTMFSPSDDESSRNAYRRYRQWTPEHHPGAYPPESIAPPYGEMMPLTDPSRQHKKLPPPTAVLNHPSSHHQRSPSQPGHYSSSQMAQLALDASRGPPPAPPHLYRPSMEEQFRTEKERMLNGLPYKHRDPQLKKERQDCAISVYRFNKNAIDPTNLSESSRREQFRQILEPPTTSGQASGNNDSDAGTSTNGTSSVVSGNGNGNGSGGVKSSSANGNSTNNNTSTINNNGGGGGGGASHRTASPDGLTTPIGHLGASVEVDAPFYCDYGYNIRIEEEVDIGPNCRIIDSCSVHIGARTIIGPDVKIITTDGCHATKRPPGSKRQLIGKKVVIGEDCFIGAGAVIMPGVTIGDRAVVGAHTIVLKNVQGPHTVVNHHHTRLLRSDYNNGPPHRY